MGIHEKELPFEIEPSEFVLNAKLNPLGVTAVTGSADLSSKCKIPMCCVLSSSLGAADSAEYFKTFAEEQMKAVGMPVTVENAMVYTVLWTLHGQRITMGCLCWL